MDTYLGVALQDWLLNKHVSNGSASLLTLSPHFLSFLYRKSGKNQHKQAIHSSSDKHSRIASNHTIDNYIDANHKVPSPVKFTIDSINNNLWSLLSKLKIVPIRIWNALEEIKQIDKSILCETSDIFYVDPEYEYKILLVLSLVQHLLCSALPVRKDLKLVIQS